MRDKKGDRIKYTNGGLTIVYEYRKKGKWICGYCRALVLEREPLQHTMSHSAFANLCLDFMWKATKE